MMSNQFSRRRTHGFSDDSPGQELHDASFIPPYPASFGYSTSSQSSFPPGQPDVLATPFSFHGVLPQKTPDLGQQYQQKQPVFQDQPKHYSQQHQAALQDQYPPHHHPPARKRLRVGSDMPLSFFSGAPVSQDDQGKSPGSEYPGDEGGGRGFSMFQTLENCFGFCQPYSAYGTTAVYQTIPSTSAYEVSAPRAYSADLQSPSQAGLAQYPDVSGSREEKNGFLGLPDSAHIPQPLQEQYPSLQPVSPTDHQPAVQENMHYQRPDTHHIGPKSEASPRFLKTERPNQDLRATDFQISSVFTHPVGSSYSHPGLAHTETNPCPEQGTRPHFIGSHGYISPGSGHSETFDYYPLVSQGSDLALMLPGSQKPPPTKRGPFKDVHQREKTARTRKIGSCIRCRMQRIRCELDPDSPPDENAACIGCKKILGNSKIHRLPCRRWKLTEVKLSKPGNVEGYPDLQWTHRWRDGTTLPEITQWQANFDERKICLSDGFSPDGITVRVRRFRVLDGDKMIRTYYHPITGEKVERRTENFALVDVAGTKAQYEDYLATSQQHIFKALLGSGDKLVRKTYDLAYWRRKDARVAQEERDLLDRTLKLWVAIRLTTRSFEIIGDETLGIEPDPEGRILLPPVMGGQLDKMFLDHILSKLRRETLEILQTMTQQKKQKTWLTTYLVSFILLHNVALITKHDKDYAEKHRMEDKTKKQRLIWARADMVKQYHLGANILLAYFHYCNKGLYPFSTECKVSDLQNLAELDPETIKYVQWTRNYVEEYQHDWELMREDGFEESMEPGADERHAKAYVNDYFFVSQLYQNNWVPRDSIIDKTAFRTIGPTRDRGRPSTKMINRSKE